MGKKIEKTSLATILFDRKGQPTDIWRRISQAITWTMPQAKDLVGCGSHGCVYIPPEKTSSPALKITNDESEARFALYQMNERAQRFAPELRGEVTYMKALALAGVKSYGKQVFALFRLPVEHGDMKNLRRKTARIHWDAATAIIDEIVEWSNLRLEEETLGPRGTADVPKEAVTLLRSIRDTEKGAVSVLEAQRIILERTDRRRTSARLALEYWYKFLGVIPGFELLAESLRFHQNNGVVFLDLGEHNVGSQHIRYPYMQIDGEQAVMFDPGGVEFFRARNFDIVAV